MKAISNRKHEHLQGAMRELTRLLEEQESKEALGLNEEVQQKRQQLDGLYKQYAIMLKQLERLTKGYEELATDIRFNLVGKQLKEMKKTMQPGCPGYEHLHLGVQLLYGT